MTDEEYEERLAAAKRQRQAAEAELQAKLDSAERIREIEAEERAGADAKARSQALDEHGADAIASYDTPLGVVIVKRPNHMQFRKFHGLKKVSPDDVEALVHKCLVHPTKGAFEHIAETYPGVPMEVAMQILDLVKARGGLSGKS